MRLTFPAEVVSVKTEIGGIVQHAGSPGFCTQHRKAGMMMPTYNSSTHDIETGGIHVYCLS